MRTSYNQSDVQMLLKDVSGLMTPLDTIEREKKIQSGVHYSEMLPVEYRPSKEYMDLYKQSLELHSKTTGDAVCNVAELIYAIHGSQTVLVSLARAGTPIGILIKRYIALKYGIQVPHYAISIIRGRGIDHNAMNFILKKHKAEQIQFVDGWIGKGAITRELIKDMKQYKGVNPQLAVLADPAGITALAGTREDFLIPNACLNGTVSGLISRTILNSEVIGPLDYHGAVYYENLENEDVSYEFIHKTEEYMKPISNIELADNIKSADNIKCKQRADFIENTGSPESITQQEYKKEAGLQIVESIASSLGIKDINFIKPGIGETTRVLLRRVPWLVLVNDITETNYIGHILKLCEEKQVEVREYPLGVYRACGIIKNMMADV